MIRFLLRAMLGFAFVLIWVCAMWAIGYLTEWAFFESRTASAMTSGGFVLTASLGMVAMALPVMVAGGLALFIKQAASLGDVLLALIRRHSPS